MVDTLKTVLCVCIAAAGFGLGSSAALADSFLDTEFASADWDHFEIEDTGTNGNLTISHEIAGGNPGAFQKGIHSWGPGLISYAHMYDPVGGASVLPGPTGIQDLDFSFDANDLSQVGDVAYLFILVQDGTYYVSTQIVLSPGSGWVTNSATVGASDFEIITSTGTAAGTPDFSVAGGAIEFGYMTRNSSGSAGVQTTWGVDNWSVDVNRNLAVPEPCSAAILGAAAIALLFRRRRRRACWVSSSD